MNREDRIFLTFLGCLIAVGVGVTATIGVTSDKVPPPNVVHQRLVDTGNARWVEHRFYRELVLAPLYEVKP